MKSDANLRIHTNDPNNSQNSHFNSRHSHRSLGFTIPELLVFMALLSVFLIVLTEIFVSVLSVQTESESTSAVEQDGRFILARFIHDINQASAITAPNYLGSPASNTLQITVDGINYSYSLNGVDLALTNDQGVNNLNSVDTNISNLAFTRLGNDLLGKNTLKLSFTIASKAINKTGQPEVKNFTTTVGMR